MRERPPAKGIEVEGVAKPNLRTKGKKFHGKDTVAGIILEHDNTYTLLSFAEPIKQALSIIHVIPKEYFDDPNKKEKPLSEWNNLTPRSLAQWLGTDIYRNQFDQNVWLRNMKLRIGELKNVIITDIRFDNEANFIKELGGIIIKVDASVRKNKSDNHISENGIDEKLVDIIVDNNGSFEDLNKSIKKTLCYLLQ